MFRSLMVIIREIYVYLTKVIFMLKHWVKLRRYINLVKCESGSLYTAYNTHRCLSQSHSALHTTHISVSLSLTLHCTQHTRHSTTC